jgi:ArsR family transcriptional regulator
MGRMDAAELFRALGDEERLRILNLLLRRHGEACVCELVDALRIPQYQVSRQLAVLRGVGLVSGEKRGTWVYYRIAPELPHFHRRVLESVAAELQNDAALEDRERFAARLRLREAGVCSVGYHPETPYREVIPLKERHS